MENSQKEELLDKKKKEENQEEENGKKCSVVMNDDQKLGEVVKKEKDGEQCYDCGNLTEENFVNRGLERWELERVRWLNQRSTVSDDDNDETQRRAVDVDVDEVIDLIFSSRWRSEPPPSNNKNGDTQWEDGSFPTPVPLPQMVDILVDLWEAEGLEI